MTIWWRNRTNYMIWIPKVYMFSYRTVLRKFLILILRIQYTQLAVFLGASSWIVFVRLLGSLQTPNKTADESLNHENYCPKMARILSVEIILKTKPNKTSCVLMWSMNINTLRPKLFFPSHLVLLSFHKATISCTCDVGTTGIQFRSKCLKWWLQVPRCSMYGIFTYIWPKFMVNVGK